MRDYAAPLLASRGYAVLLASPRGSSGRGREFAAAVRGDMGGADTRDYLSENPPRPPGQRHPFPPRPVQHGFRLRLAPASLPRLAADFGAGTRHPGDGCGLDLEEATHQRADQADMGYQFSRPPYCHVQGNSGLHPVCSWPTHADAVELGPTRTLLSSASATASPTSVTAS
jgi:hypothetical protein